MLSKLFKLLLSRSSSEGYAHPPSTPTSNSHEDASEEPLDSTFPSNAEDGLPTPSNSFKVDELPDTSIEHWLSTTTSARITGYEPSELRIQIGCEWLKSMKTRARCPLAVPDEWPTPLNTMPREVNKSHELPQSLTLRVQDGSMWIKTVKARNQTGLPASTKNLPREGSKTDEQSERSASRAASRARDDGNFWPAPLQITPKSRQNEQNLCQPVAADTQHETKKGDITHLNGNAELECEQNPHHLQASSCDELLATCPVKPEEE